MPLSVDHKSNLLRSHHPLQDADPLLCDYYINMTQFEQHCEPTGATYPVRREFYPGSSPAGKGAKWEWGGDTTAEWHIYDMEVQVSQSAWHAQCLVGCVNPSLHAAREMEGGILTNQSVTVVA